MSATVLGALIFGQILVFMNFSVFHKYITPQNEDDEEESMRYKNDGSSEGDYESSRGIVKKGRNDSDDTNNDDEAQAALDKIQKLIGQIDNTAGKGGAVGGSEIDLKSDTDDVLSGIYKLGRDEELEQQQREIYQRAAEQKVKDMEQQIKPQKTKRKVKKKKTSSIMEGEYNAAIQDVDLESLQESFYNNPGN